VRAVFCGASGTGKTTLMRHVVERTGLEVCPVGSRQVAEAMGYGSPYDVDADGKRDQFQRRLFAEKRDWELAHDSFVSDRSAFDNLVYATMHGVRMTVEEIEEYVEAMRYYTHVVYLPVSAFHNIGEDPYRVKEGGYHAMFDVVLRALFLEYGVTPHKVWRQALDARKQQVSGILKLSGKEEAR
jgi:predicted ATPase